MSTATAQVSKPETAKPALGIAASIVAMPKQSGKINYRPEQLERYLESQLTGKALVGKPFDQSVGDTNFTEEDRKRIQEARRLHRETLATGEAKAAIMHEVKSPAWKLIGARENAKGNRRGLRLFNPTIQA